MTESDNDDQPNEKAVPEAVPVDALTAQPTTVDAKRAPMCRPDDPIDGKDMCLCCGLCCCDIALNTKGRVLGCVSMHKCCCCQLVCCLQPCATPPLLCSTKAIPTLGCGPIAISPASLSELPACDSSNHCLCVLCRCSMPVLATSGIVPSCVLSGLMCDPDFGCCITLDQLNQHRGHSSPCMVQESDVATWCCIVCIATCCYIPMLVGVCPSLGP